MSQARPEAGDAPLARLLAGGRHNRLLILGAPPAGLHIPDTGHFERTARLSRPGGGGQCIADAERLPFVEALFDRILVTTPLPPGKARAELRELWRVMTPAALALLVIRARRPWQFAAAGWLADDLKPILEDAMFATLDQHIAAIPDRHHLILVAKRDGLRAAPIGLVETSQAAAIA